MASCYFGNDYVTEGQNHNWNKPRWKREIPHDLNDAQKIKINSIEGERGSEVTRDWEIWRSGWSEEEGLPNATKRK
jgi:hypothetical protein